MRYILFAVLLYFSLSVFAQKETEWNLEKCIQYAIDNNIQVKQQELNADYSKNTLTQSKAGILPTLNGFASHQYNFGTSVDPFTYDFTETNISSTSLSLSSSITLFSGLQKFNQIQQNKFSFLASLENVEKMKNDISLNIASAYLQILFSEELLANAQNQLSITQEQLDRTKKLVEAGSLAQGNLFEIEAQLASEELQTVNAENQLTMAYLTLQQLMELDSIDNFGIAKPILPEVSENLLNESVDQIFEKAYGNLPQVRAAEYQLQSSEKGLQSAQGARSPRISANATWWGSGYSSARERYTNFDTIIGPAFVSGYTASGEDVYSYMNSLSYDTEPIPFMNQVRDNRSTTFSFTMSIPIFNNWQINTAVSNAKINVLNSRYQLENTKNMLYKEIQQAHADAGAAMKRYIATKKAVQSMDEAFFYTQQKFGVGLVTSVDFNLAKNQLNKAKSDLLQSKYEYIFKTKILDFYMGNPIKL